MKSQIIERKGKQFALVPLREFEQLVHDSEMLEDIRAYDAAKTRNEETFPREIADQLIAGTNPVRVFRLYRGLTQESLAKRAKIARAYLAELETGRKRGSVRVLKSIAASLRVDIDDLAV